jgi:hypothetical protein
VGRSIARVGFGSKVCHGQHRLVQSHHIMRWGLPMESVRDYFRSFAALPKLAGQIGDEEAAKRLAEQARGLADPGALAAQVQAIRKKHRLTGEDARSAFWILQEYHWNNYARRSPVMGRAARFFAALMRYKYPKPVLETPDEVIVQSPWGVACPIVRGFDGDLEKCRLVCEACFRHDVIMEPDQIALLKVASPTLRLELRKFREDPEQSCEYALVTG